MEIRDFTLLSVVLVFIALLFFLILRNTLGKLLKTLPAGLGAESLSGMKRICMWVLGGKKKGCKSIWCSLWHFWLGLYWKSEQRCKPMFMAGCFLLASWNCTIGVTLRNMHYWELKSECGLIFFFLTKHFPGRENVCGAVSGGMCAGCEAHASPGRFGGSSIPEPDAWAAVIARLSFSLIQTLAHKCCNKASYLLVSLV